MKKLITTLFVFIFLTISTQTLYAQEQYNDLIKRSEFYILEFNKGKFKNFVKDMQKEGRVKHDAKTIKEQWENITSYAGPFKTIAETKTAEDQNGFIVVSINSEHEKYNIISNFYYTQDKKIQSFNSQTIYLDENDNPLVIAKKHSQLLRDGNFDDFYKNLTAKYQTEISLESIKGQYQRSIKTLGTPITEDKTWLEAFDQNIVVLVVRKHEEGNGALLFFYDYNHEIEGFFIITPPEELVETLFKT